MSRWLGRSAITLTIALVAAAPAHAVTVRLGPPTIAATTSSVLCGLAATGNCSFVFGAIAAPSAVLEAPRAGTVTSWRIHSPGPASDLRLLVVRAEGGAWKTVRTGAPATAADGSPMATNLPIEAGDRIGVTVTGTPGLSGVMVATAPTASLLYFGQPLGASPASGASVAGSEMQFNADVTLTPPAITSLSPAAGPTRNPPQVTIAGTGLEDADAVTFDGSPATIVSNTRTAIVVRPPDHLPGTVDVAVKTLGGTATSQYRYFERPVVSEVTPNAGPTAGGTAVVIRGSGFEGATRVAFGDAEARVISVTPTRIEAVSPAHPAGTVDVTVSNPGSTSATSAADAFTYRDDAGSAPTPPAGPGARPALRRLAISPATLRPRGTARITFRLDKAARVRFVVRRRVRGKLRRVRVFRARGVQGTNTRTLRARGLAPGRYVLTVRATDAAGAKSKARRISFRVRG